MEYMFCLVRSLLGFYALLPLDPMFDRLGGRLYEIVNLSVHKYGVML